MSIRNQNWYNLQSTRRYPLDDNSTGIDDSGDLIRDDILVDCNIRFPNTYGPYAYIQGITVSAGLVTVLIGAANSLDAANGVSIAAVSLVKPVASNVNHAITALVPGISGWLTFGPGVEQGFVARYTTPRQSLLNPRNAKPYRPLPIPSIKKLQLSTALQGIVRLTGATPVKIHYVENAGDVIDMSAGGPVPFKNNISAIVAELDLSRRTETFDPLRALLGPCAQRPESGTCPETPIETINGVAPDCNGNIQIVFTGFEASNFNDCGGADILTETDLPVVCDAVNRQIGDPGAGGPGSVGEDQCCTPDRVVANETALQNIPLSERFVGMLVRTANTNEFWTLNSDLGNWVAAPAQEDCTFPNPTRPRPTSATPSSAPPTEDGELVGDERKAKIIPDVVIDMTSAGSRQAYPCMLLPTCWDFVGCDYSGIAHPNAFSTSVGSFELMSRLAPAICPCEHMVGPENFGAVLPEKETTIFQNSAQYSTHNVYVAKNLTGLSMAHLQNCPTDWSVGKTVAVEFSADPVYGKQVGGLFLNYSTEYAQNTPVTRHVAVVHDARAAEIKIIRYRYFSPILEAAAPFKLTPGEWCQLHVTPILNGANVSLHVVARGSKTSDFGTLFVDIPLNLYGDITGFVGLFADQSYIYFNKFAVTNEYSLIVENT